MFIERLSFSESIQIQFAMEFICVHLVFLLFPPAPGCEKGIFLKYDLLPYVQYRAKVSIKCVEIRNNLNVNSIQMTFPIKFFISQFTFVYFLENFQHLLTSIKKNCV